MRLELAGIPRPAPARFQAWVPILAAALALILAGCGPAARTIPLGPESMRSGDGKWVERRVDYYGNGRVGEVWYVYRDTAGNFVRHGDDKHYYRNGQLKFTEHYRDGRLEGSTEFWYQNGAKQGELPFRNGKPHGKALTWFPDGRKKSEKSWVDGQLHGLSLEWDKKGRKVEEVMWIRNRRAKPGEGAAAPGSD